MMRWRRSQPVSRSGANYGLMPQGTLHRLTPLFFCPASCLTRRCSGRRLADCRGTAVTDRLRSQGERIEEIASGPAWIKLPKRFALAGMGHWRGGRARDLAPWRRTDLFTVGADWGQFRWPEPTCRPLRPREIADRQGQVGAAGRNAIARELAHPLWAGAPGAETRAGRYVEIRAGYG